MQSLRLPRSMWRSKATRRTEGDVRAPWRLWRIAMRAVRGSYEHKVGSDADLADDSAHSGVAHDNLKLGKQVHADTATAQSP